MKKYTHIHLESIDSTNSYARDYILSHRAKANRQSPQASDAQRIREVRTASHNNPADSPLPLLVTTYEQTAGRGRYGHSFLSPKGGIYMSYAYEREYSEDELLQVTTKVAELILPVLERHYRGGSAEKLKLHIKPVNDIYIGNPADPESRKIAGILTERVDYPERINCHDHPGYFIIVGIGINCIPFDVPAELKETIGFLEPDCDIPTLIEEIAEVLAEL